MTLIISLPCYNEEETLALTLSELPARLPGIDRIQTMIVDDGSTDGTVAVARAAGVNQVILLPHHQGLARAFAAGLAAAMAAGADIVVTMDADHQYRAADIPLLIGPILEGKADMVIGVRNIGNITEFSRVKKLLHMLGSIMAGIASGMWVSDPVSGFRAFSRSAAERLRVRNRYTYTLETLIQAGRQGMNVRTVPVGRNAPSRPSRLIRSNAIYVIRQAGIIIRTWMRYGPLSFCIVFGTATLAVAALLSPFWLL